MTSNLHHKINLRARMIESLTKKGIKDYGKGSMWVNNPLFKIQIAQLVSQLLKNI